MTRLALVSAAAVLLTALTPSASQADLIYDNTTTAFTGNWASTALQIGNEITAGGTARSVAQLEIGLWSQREPATLSTLQAFLYANDGAGGAPGTLLWQSAVKQNIALTGSPDLIAFTVPNVTVPDTFTWTVQVGAATPVAALLPVFGPPTVGSFVDDWFGGPGSWGHGGAPYPLIYEARITAAVPEFSTATLAGVLGVMGLVGAWVRRKCVAA
jgi:hypothetical protein